MFVLICPQCGHEVKVKRARVGATATCVQCKSQYKVEEKTMRQEGPEEQPVSGELAPMPPIQAAPPSSADTPPMMAPALHSLVDATRVNQVDEAQRAAEVMAEIESEFSSDVSGSRSSLRRRRHRGIGSRLTVPALLLTLALVGLLAWLMMGRLGGPSDSGGKKDPAPVNTQVPPVQPPPVTDIKPVPPPVIEDEPGELVLQTIPEAEAEWERFSKPVAPFQLKPVRAGAQWTDWMQKVEGDKGAGLFCGVYITDSAMVWRKATLQVQLLNTDGQAYAQLNQELPVLCGRQSLEVRVPVPADLMEPYRRLRSEVIPHEPVSDAVVLEVATHQLRQVTSRNGRSMIELAIRNPSPGSEAKNPQLVVEVIGEEGAPRGLWQGKLEGAIRPREQMAFRMSLPTQRGEGFPGFLRVRAYGEKSP